VRNTNRGKVGEPLLVAGDPSMRFIALHLVGMTIEKRLLPSLVFLAKNFPCGAAVLLALVYYKK